MTTPITLPEFYGLLALMLTAEEHDRSYDHNGVICSTGQIGKRHGTFEAAGPDFTMIALFPGWHGDYAVVPVHLFIQGDMIALFQWLPIAVHHKHAIINHLPVSKAERALIVLAV